MNNFLLAGDKCMPEMHLKQAGFELKTLWRQVIQILFTEMSPTKLNTIWIMVNQRFSKKNSIIQSFKR